MILSCLVLLSSESVLLKGGSVVKFVPPHRSEISRKGEEIVTTKTRDQCITFMKEYKGKSVEETLGGLRSGT